MEAAPIREYRVENLSKQAGGIELLKSNVLFGHNSSGKTNLIRAIWAFRSLVLYSSNEALTENLMVYQPFRLNVVGGSLPTEFKVEFIHDNQHLRYHISFDQNQIQLESLTEILSRSEKNLMFRTTAGFQFAPSIRKESERRVAFVRPNALAISTLATLNSVWANSIQVWFQNLAVHMNLDSREAIQRSAELMLDKSYEKMLLAFLSNAKLGFTAVKIEPEQTARRSNATNSIAGFMDRIAANEPPKAYQIVTRHKVFGSDGRQVDELEFDLMANESIGAQKFFALIGPIAYSLRHGHPIIIDEMDSHLSSFLISLILKLFNSNHYNTKGAQLIFSTQNTDVLEHNFEKTEEQAVNFGYLRRDQIAIFEKTAQGATAIRSLHQIGIRNDASYRKQYLEGQFFKEKPPGTQLRLFD